MKTQNIFLLLAVLLFSACTSFKMVTDQKAEAVFSNYHTYTVEYENKLKEQNQYINALNQERFDKLLQEALLQKGMIEADGEEDIIVKVVTEVETKTNYSTSYNNMAVGRRYYRGGVAFSDTREYHTNEGMMTIALLEAETNELLWYTTVRTSLNEKPKKVEENMQKLIEKVMEVFPINHNDILVDNLETQLHR